MAREIYADPFGAYIGGYDTGAQREQQLQRGVRDARQMDWQFYNMNPLELRVAQRADELGVEALPYQKRMLPIGYENARVGMFENQMRANAPLDFLGITEPTRQAISQYTGLPVDPRITGVDLNYARPSIRAEDRQNADIELQNYYRALEVQRARDQTDAYRTSVDNQNPALRPGGGSAGYNPSMYFGSPAAPTAAPAPVAAPASTAAPPVAATGAAPPAFNVVLDAIAKAYNLTPEQMQLILQGGMKPAGASGQW